MSFDPNISNYKPSVQGVNLTQGGGGGNTGYYQQGLNNDENIADQFTKFNIDRETTSKSESLVISIWEFVIQFIRNIIIKVMNLLGIKLPSKNPFIIESEINEINDEPFEDTLIEI